MRAPPRRFRTARFQLGRHHRRHAQQCCASCGNRNGGAQCDFRQPRLWESHLGVVRQRCADQRVRNKGNNMGLTGAERGIANGFRNRSPRSSGQASSCRTMRAHPTASGHRWLHPGRGKPDRVHRGAGIVAYGNNIGRRSTTAAIRSITIAASVAQTSNRCIRPDAERSRRWRQWRERRAELAGNRFREPVRQSITLSYRVRYRDCERELPMRIDFYANRRGGSGAWLTQDSSLPRVRRRCARSRCWFRSVFAPFHSSRAPPTRMDTAANSRRPSMCFSKTTSIDAPRFAAPHDRNVALKRRPASEPAC